MNIKNLVILILLGFSTQGLAQSNSKLAAKIEQLASHVIPNINSEDVFLNTGKSLISSADHSEVKKIVMSNGFPTISMVGRENSHKFWMMVQLCNTDTQFQTAVLKQMGRANRKGDIIQEDYAMLADRIRVNKELPQIYGTQYVFNNFGDVILYPIQDEANVNERRKVLNLSKISDSEAQVKDTLAKSEQKSSGPNDRPISKN